MRKLCLTISFVLLTLQAMVGTAQTVKALHTFTGGTDGASPFGGVLRDAAGNLYGTTEFGGDPTCAYQRGCGTVFKIDAAGVKTTLHIFRGSDGAAPRAALIQDAAGNLYGTTFFGGDRNCGIREGCGTVFKIDTSNKFSVLHRFSGLPDGANPWSGLLADASGNLYGTTTEGGTTTSVFTGGCGVVFKIDAKGHESILYRFKCGIDGGASYSTLVRDTQGNLYGTTILGGNLNCGPLSFGCGTVFKIDPAGNETVLHAFAPGGDASAPQAGLTYFNGFFYGTSSTGGTLGEGAVYKIDLTGNESVVYSFGSNSGDGLFPIDALVHDSEGNLYGTTGIIKSTIFKIETSGNETLLYSFGGGPTGFGPTAGLTQDSTGNLYGTTSVGSASSSNFGAVFELEP